MTPLELGELPLAPGAAQRASELALDNPNGSVLTRTVLDQVRRHADARPDAPAVITAGGVTTYAELLAAVAATEAELRTGGCVTGALVACLGPRCDQTIVLFLAIEAVGAVYVPVDPAWPPARITDVIEQSGAALVVDYDLDGLALRERPGPRRPAEPARYVIYTSGTTGLPKGAIVEPAGMLNHLAAKVADLALTLDDRMAFTAPLVFDISICQMLAPLVAGGAVVVVADDDILFPARLYRLLARHEVSVVELVPTAINALLDLIARRGAEPALPRLRWLISTGEELRPTLAERALTLLPAVGLLNAYGPTECSDDVTHHRVTLADVARSRIPIGRPIYNAVLYILIPDETSGVWSAAERGEIGEIFVGGITVGRGYLGAPEITRGAFYSDPFDSESPTGRVYRTGDLGRVDDETVQYLGRVDRQVKVAGVRMELGEIEAILSRHPAIEECAVTLSDRDGRTLLVAHYVASSSVTQDQLDAYLRTVLPAGSIPRTWTQHSALPLTHNGKIDFRALGGNAPGQG
jgi:D-alanine--poly(phosphoribitol) ligase subunit 1